MVPEEERGGQMPRLHVAAVSEDEVVLAGEWGDGVAAGGNAPYRAAAIPATRVRGVRPATAVALR